MKKKSQLKRTFQAPQKTQLKQRWSMRGVWDFEAEGGKDGEDGEDDEGCNAVAAAMTEVFLEVDRGLLDEDDIEASF